VQTSRDGWEPDQYHRFRQQRSAPFFDLLDLLRAVPGGRVADLGCGTGELTVALHQRVGASETIGVDRSVSMLAAAPSEPGVSFVGRDMRDVGDLGPFDIVASNAALQWVPDHAEVLALWSGLLRAGGQLAVQVPANADHPSHQVAAEVAREPEFADAFPSGPPPDPVLSVLRPEQYASVLDRLGYAEQHVRLQVYGHRLASSAEVVEWVRGTSLVRFREQLAAPVFDRLVERYRVRLLEVIGEQSPYFYPFKRILLWAAR